MFPPGNEDAPARAEETPPKPQQTPSSSEASDREKDLEARLTEMGRTNASLSRELAELKGRLDERSTREREAQVNENVQARNAQMAELMKTVFSSDDADAASQAMSDLLTMHGENVAGAVRQEVEQEFGPRLRRTEGNTLRSTVERTLTSHNAPKELSDPQSPFFAFMQEKVGENEVLSGLVGSGKYRDAVDYVYKLYVAEKGDPSVAEDQKNEARKEASMIESSPSALDVTPDIQAILDDEETTDMADIWERLDSEGVFQELERGS